ITEKSPVKTLVLSRWHDLCGNSGADPILQSLQERRLRREFTAERRLPQTTADYRSAGNSTANLKRRFATRKRVTQDAPDHLAVLLHHRAGVVVLAITLADLAHFHRHLRIAPCRDIR